MRIDAFSKKYGIAESTVRTYKERPELSKYIKKVGRVLKINNPEEFYQEICAIMKRRYGGHGFNIHTINKNLKGA